MRNLAPLILALVATGCFGGKDKDSGSLEGGPWLIEELDLGSPLAKGTGYAVGNGDALWFAAEQFVPELRYTYPASSIPLYLWDEIALGENVADVGSCPYTTLEGNTQLWKSNCRSQDGYDWTGEMAVTEWEDEDGRWTQWDMDLEILGEVEGAAFDRLTLEGTIAFVLGDGESFDRAVQTNARAGIEGWFVRHNVNDQREQAWQDWVMTGRYEETSSGHRIEGTVDLGQLGGMEFDGAGIKTSPTCSGEPVGDLHIVADEDAVVEFDGDGTCDRCADLVVDGVFAGKACGT